MLWTVRLWHSPGRLGSRHDFTNLKGPCPCLIHVGDYAGGGGQRQTAVVVGRKYMTGGV